MQLKKKIRSWTVGLKKDIHIKEIAQIKLKLNEQVSFYSDNLNKI